jgi:hypothetical protein
MQRKEQLITIMLAALMLCVAAGCDGDGGEPDCEGVANLCDGELGNYRCSTDSGSIEVCQHNDDGCPVWTEYQVCDTDEVCDDSGDAPECTCQDVCSTLGDTRCQGTVVQTCSTAASGCLDWADTQDCADDGLSCSLVSGEAQCTEGCTDECEYQDQGQCSGDIIQTCNMGADGCLHWEDVTDCSLTLQACDDTSGTPECITTCTGNCPVADMLRCSGTVIQVCTLNTDGCLYWEDGTDCADTDQVCEIVDLVAQCVDECTDECDTTGETQCSGTVIQTCTAGTDGCNDWVDGTDCADTGNTCDDTDEPAECINGSGDSCTDVEVIVTTPFTKTGTDFTAVYTDTMDLAGTDCTTRTGSREAVFAINLTTGDILRVEEAGGLDAVVSVQATCGGSEACLVSEDDSYDDTITYTATADGTVYIVVEAWSSSPTTVDYDIRVDIGGTEACGDSADNDFDGLVDCDDPDCFGDATYCTSETNCGDGEDNDNDTLIDCADTTDCTGDVFCQESCADPIAVTTFPYRLTGTDFLVAFDDDQDLGGTDCMTRTGSVEAVFAVTVTAGDTIRLSEHGSLDAVLSLQETCGDSEVCVFSEDLGETGGYTYTATADGTVYAIVEAYYTTTSYVDFDILIEKGVAEVCNDTTDNDFDGFIDCDDGDCYGTGTCALPTIVVNEVAYDDDGTDDREMVEIFAASGAIDLTGLSLVHINGSDGAEIWAIDLAGFQTNGAGFFYIGSSYYANADAYWTDFSITDTNAVQNGPESVAIYFDYGGSSEAIVDVVEYEGDGSGPGEGTPAPTVAYGSWQNSIGRYPDGTDTGDNGADFVLSWWTTEGLANTPAQPGAAFQRLTGSSDGDQTLPMAIPDNDATGIDLTATGPSFLGTTISDIHFGIRITHTYQGDLVVRLTDPAGITVTMHDRSGGGTDDLMTVYDLVTTPATGTMDDFLTHNPQGVWTVHVHDGAGGDVGNVLEWVLWVDDGV